VRRAVAAGVGGIVVDWEWRGKELRQANADTQINRHTLDDLRAVRAATSGPIVCRLNAFGRHTEAELEQAIEGGADEVLLPMVRSAHEVTAALHLARGRCGVGILVETAAAVEAAPELARLPLSRVYVGLNDLAIDRRSPTIFTALADGTAERVRRAFDAPFGVAGLTVPELGSPLPCRLLIGELTRLGCGFSFLRRSFHRDTARRDVAVEVPRLLDTVTRAAARGRAQVERDRAELVQAVEAIEGELAVA
jgi:hypothetical protein